ILGKWNEVDPYEEMKRDAKFRVGPVPPPGYDTPGSLEFASGGKVIATRFGVTSGGTYTFVGKDKVRIEMHERGRTDSGTLDIVKLNKDELVLSGEGTTVKFKRAK